MNNFQLFLSLIFGVLPYERLNKQASIIRSYLLMYIMPLIYLVCFGLACLGSFRLHVLSECKIICRLSNTLFLIMGLCLYLLIHFVTLWRRKQFFIDFKKSMDDIDEYLRKCDEVGIKKKKKLKPKYMYYATWFVVIASFTVATAYDVYEFVHYYQELFFIGLLSSSFPYLASSLVMGLFVHYVGEISKRFHKLNELFQRINYESDSKYIPVTVFDIETEAEKDFAPNQRLRHRHIGQNVAINDFKHIEEGLSAADNISSHLYTATSETNLPQLFKIHDKILSLSVRVNAEFGLQSVPFMLACFILSISNIFLQIKVLFKVGGTFLLLDFVLIRYFFWNLATMQIAYLVLRMCCNSNKFSKQSAMIVHDIMQKKPAFMLGNDIYYNKMKSFTLQFIHWERYFQFNGFGLFVLDYTFIFSMISSAFSYFIVVLQFDMMSVFQQDGLI